MSVYYSVYAEANVDGHWYNLCPFFKNRDGVYKTGCLFWAQSAFREIHYDLQSRAIGHGIPEDISEGLREVFPQKLDEVVEGGWSKKTWGEYYKQSLYQVNFAQAIAPKVNKTKPFKYEGYVFKKELAAFEVYEIDEFSEWLTEEEYQALSEKERRQYIFHRWNDPYGDYGIYVEIYRKVRVLCSLFQDVMEEELGGSLWDGITDSQVRLYVYFG